MLKVLRVKNDLLDASLIKNGGQLVVMKKVDHRVLYEKPRANESETTVLPIEPVVVGIESEMIEEKEAQPVTFAQIGVTAHGIVLVGHPND